VFLLEQLNLVEGLVACHKGLHSLPLPGVAAASPTCHEVSATLSVSAQVRCRGVVGRGIDSSIQLPCEVVFMLTSPTLSFLPLLLGLQDNLSAPIVKERRDRYLSSATSMPITTPKLHLFLRVANLLKVPFRDSVLLLAPGQPWLVATE